MKKTIAALFALGAIATTAAPAMAQPYGGHEQPGYGQPGYGQPGYGQRGPGDRGPGDMRGRDDRGFGDLRARVDQVLAKVDRAMHSDRLTRSERNSLSYRANKLSTMERRFERDGFNGYERATLEREAADLDARVDRATRDDHHGRWH
jgi:hypothetical protein